MVTVKDFLEKLKRVNVKSMTVAIINENQKEITELNIDTLAKGKNYKDELVGRYSLLTQMIASEDPRPLLPKIAGEPYNFIWGGDLVGNVKAEPKADKILFDSTGKGTGDKLEFVEKNKLIGLTINNEQILNNDILRPNYVNKLKNALNL